MISVLFSIPRYSILFPDTQSSIFPSRPTMLSYVSWDITIFHFARNAHPISRREDRSLFDTYVFSHLRFRRPPQAHHHWNHTHNRYMPVWWCLRVFLLSFYSQLPSCLPAFTLFRINAGDNSNGAWDREKKANVNKYLTWKTEISLHCEGRCDKNVPGAHQNSFEATGMPNARNLLLEKHSIQHQKQLRWEKLGLEIIFRWFTLKVA